MGKNLLQDMIKRNSTPQAKRPPSRILELTRESIKSQPTQPTQPTQLPQTSETVAEAPQQQVVTPPVLPIMPPTPQPETLPQTPPAVKYEPVDYSKFETRFASINDTSDSDDGESRIKGSHYKLWIVAVCSVLFLVFALSYLFSSAKILINPKTKTVTANLDLSAVKDISQGGLTFDLMAISGEASKAVTAGPEKDVEVTAKGKVIIYNAYSASAQPLAIDTRLEGSNGKIYKTTTKLTVPGMKGSTPGSIEVSAYAAEVGPEYNAGPLDFKIFGFKGTPKYAKFYARGVGDMTGGFKGKSVDLSDADRAQLVKDLKVSLKDKLQKQAVSQIPSGFILYKNAVVLNTNGDNITTATANNITTATLKGTLSGFLFEEKKLTQKIAESILTPTEDASQILIPNIRDLTFSLANQDNLPVDIKNINFNVTGSLKFVYKIDNAKLISEVTGQSKKEFNSILATYPNIDSAQLVIRPFWKTSLPDKQKDIQIIIDYPSTTSK